MLGLALAQLNPFKCVAAPVPKKDRKGLPKILKSRDADHAPLTGDLSPIGCGHSMYQI